MLLSWAVWMFIQQQLRKVKEGLASCGRDARLVIDAAVICLHEARVEQAVRDLELLQISPAWLCPVDTAVRSETSVACLQ